MAEEYIKSPAQIFSEISAALMQENSFDADLAKIIRQKILIVDSKDDAVPNALKAIQKLARQRAGIEG